MKKKKIVLTVRTDLVEPLLEKSALLQQNPNNFLNLCLDGCLEAMDSGEPVYDIPIVRLWRDLTSMGWYHLPYGQWRALLEQFIVQVAGKHELPLTLNLAGRAKLAQIAETAMAQAFGPPEAPKDEKLHGYFMEASMEMAKWLREEGAKRIERQSDAMKETLAILDSMASHPDFWPDGKTPEKPRTVAQKLTAETQRLRAELDDVSEQLRELRHELAQKAPEFAELLRLENRQRELEGQIAQAQHWAEGAQRAEAELAEKVRKE